jgi:glycosyltransferase involved in cell wall biosynthesis
LRLAAMTEDPDRLPTLSVIVPTRNRPESLRRTVARLCDQDLPRSLYEVIVVDDGSAPPAEAEGLGNSRVRLLRRSGGERSAARNGGAEIAHGRILVFIDDDITAERGLLTAHLAGHQDWSGALAVGAVHLPRSIASTPFGSFRMRLEQAGAPTVRGPVAIPNLCTAQNMSLSSEHFRELGGFAVGMSSGEDQDLALRHSAAGGRIVYLPDATVTHDDPAVDIRSYCRRHEWGAEHMIPFLLRHPEWPDNQERLEANGPVNWRRDASARVIKKLMKSLLAAGMARALLFAAIDALERFPERHTLDALYRLALGVHLQRGFRRGWARQAGVDDEVPRLR